MSNKKKQNKTSYWQRRLYAETHAWAHKRDAYFAYQSIIRNRDRLWAYQETLVGQVFF